MNPGDDPSLLTRLAELAVTKPARIELAPFTLALLVSLVASIFIAYFYRSFSSSRATSGPVHRTFPLLAVAVTSIFICIQYSLPLSLGLLGALSIVRFRTPIKETEEIGFILLVIATSLACATFNLVLVAGILAVALVALLARRVVRKSFDVQADEGSLILSLAAPDYTARGREVLSGLQAALPRPRVESIVHHDEEVVLALAFRPLAPTALADLEGKIRELRPRSFTLLAGRNG